MTATNTATAIWARLTKDVRAAVSAMTDRRRVVGRYGNRIMVQPVDPNATANKTIMKIKGAPIDPGDDVLTLSLGGREVAIGALLRDDDLDTGLGGTSDVSISVGTVSTGAAGSSVVITEGGTEQHRIFNFTIPRGDKGDKGDTGTAATVAIGSVSTGAAGSSASVSNSGTSSAAVLNFTIPRGDKGDKGDPGTAATITGATATGLAAGASPTVTLGGTSTARTFAFGIPKGDKGDTGDTGPAGTITSATATGLAAGASPTVTLGGTPSARTFAFGIPKGDKGDQGDPGPTGPAGTITGATATGLAAGASPTVTLGGTASARTFAFGIPKGDKGDPGTPGAAASVTVGTTTTGAPGTSASVSNSGTSSAAVLNFVIPKGEKGDPGSVNVSGDGSSTDAARADHAHYRSDKDAALMSYGTVLSDDNTGAVVLGMKNGTQTEDRTTIIGSYTQGVVGSNTVSIGHWTANDGTHAVGIGNNTSASGDRSVAIGREAKTEEASAVALGAEAQAYLAGVAIGRGAFTAWNGIAIGYDADSQHKGIALGYGAVAGGHRSIAIGAHASEATPDRAKIKANDLVIERSNGTGATSLIIFDANSVAKAISINSWGDLLVAGTPVVYRGWTPNNIWQPNKTIASGGPWSFRAAPVVDSGNLIETLAAGRTIYDSGFRYYANGYTWASIYVTSRCWGWIVQDAIV